MHSYWIILLKFPESKGAMKGTFQWRADVVIAIKTLLRAGWSLLQQHWNLTLSCMISGLLKVDALICSNLLIMQISAGQHFMQPKSNNILCAVGFCKWESTVRPVLGSAIPLLTVASFSSSANVWPLLICRMCQTQSSCRHCNTFLIKEK